MFRLCALHAAPSEMDVLLDSRAVVLESVLRWALRATGGSEGPLQQRLDDLPGVPAAATAAAPASSTYSPSSPGTVLCSQAAAQIRDAQSATQAAAPLHDSGGGGGGGGGGAEVEEAHVPQRVPAAIIHFDTNSDDYFKGVKALLEMYGITVKSDADIVAERAEAQAAEAAAAAAAAAAAEAAQQSDGDATEQSSAENTMAVLSRIHVWHAQRQEAAAAVASAQAALAELDGQTGAGVKQRRRAAEKELLHAQRHAQRMSEEPAPETASRAQMVYPRLVYYSGTGGPASRAIR
eukprot:COSAG01_NODE_1732_length_9368_cov_13.977452_1_plen_293_part_00